MKKYRIPFEVNCTIYVEVEAEDKQEAIEKAENEVYLSAYVGNGGNDKLMGVSDSNLSVEPGENFDVLEHLIEVR